MGASGDLAPLSHLALGLLGEGQMWSPKSGWADAALVLKAYGLGRLQLQPKEGLALINGTQLITSLGAEAVERARMIARQADIIAAMSLEVLKGTTRAFDVLIQQVRPHVGQRRVAERLRSLLHSSVYPSEIAESHRFCNRVQDAYTLRCCPQVHGIVNDTIDFVQDVITTEMNSATDNPIVFADQGEILSCGNFHGEYPAKVLDYLAIGVHELANMSERRIERLVNPGKNNITSERMPELSMITVVSTRHSFFYGISRVLTEHLRHFALAIKRQKFVLFVQIQATVPKHVGNRSGHAFCLFLCLFLLLF